MIVSRIILGLSGCMVLALPGCAITSSRSFPYSFLENVEDTGLRSAINLQPYGVLQLLTLTGTVEIPPLLHVDYERPPYSIHLRIEDTSNSFERIEVSSITVQYAGEEPETFVPKKKVLTFQNGSEHPDAWAIFHKEITRHDRVTITITGKAIKHDGSEMEIQFSHSFEPTSYNNMTDWFSWCASV